MQILIKRQLQSGSVSILCLGCSVIIVESQRGDLSKKGQVINKYVEQERSQETALRNTTVHG